MTETADLTSALEQTLPAIDRDLAKRDITLAQRPLEAAIAFALNYVQAVQYKGAAAVRPSTPEKFLVTQWFASLYAQVETWYRGHYPGAMQQTRDDRIFGIVMIAGTVFAIRIPATRTRPGKPGETVWLSFPDGLRDGEHVLDWIEAPPNFSMLSLKEHQDAEESATEVGNALRFIRTGLMAVSGGDDKLDGFKAGVMPRLRHAADLLLEPNPELVQQAYWELQLACEAGLKVLLLQRTGVFQQTHNLFELYDAVPAPPPAFNRDLLKCLPRWKETAELRYGQGNRENRAECVKCYRSALTIVAGTIRSMEKLGIGDAEFEIAQPPWMAQS